MNNIANMDSLKAQRLYLMGAGNIESITSRPELDRLEQGLESVYDAGFLTEMEYSMLCEKIVDKFLLLNHWALR